jgi:UDP-3-O-[3-hydroxymyristoyl] glucosamine N-acyltransferase
MPESFKSDFISKLVDGVCSDNDVIVNNFSSLSEANSTSITFYNDPSYKSQLINTNAALVILREFDQSLCKKPTIVVADPYLAYAKVSSLFQIGSNSYIGSNVVIGRNVIIHSNVYIANDVKIGNDCEIFPGAKIGTDGFGYARDKNKEWLKIPQTGSVIIGDNVDIGANTTIDRGAIDNTLIHNGVKIDNLVQIGHNCIIGENSIIAGCAGIAGSTIIGKNCMIGGAAMIKGHITIADDTIISGGTGIGKNVENPGKRFTNVFPYNLEHKDWLRIANNLKKMGKKND